jgi:hypothetical protein
MLDQPRVYLPLASYGAPVGQPLQPPSRLKATALSTTQVLLTWDDNAASETGYYLTNGGDWWHYTAANTTMHVATGMPASSYQCFYAIALGSSGSSEWSGWACTSLHTQTGVYGRVTANGVPAAGVSLELRRYNGSSYSPAGLTTTGDQGTYLFANVASLQPGEHYYVRYLNGASGNANDPSRLNGWWGGSLTNFLVGQDAHGGTFDIGNVLLKFPTPSRTVSLPVLFHWARRPGQAETYALELIHNSTGQYVSTGYTGYLELQQLPDGVTANGPSYWGVAVNTADGGYGLSYWISEIFFSSSANGVEGAELGEPVRRPIQEEPLRGP